jgi:hypothetical protein
MEKYDGFFGLDLLYEEDIDDNFPILEKHKENINEINITIKNAYDANYSGMENYISYLTDKIAVLQNLSIIHLNNEMDIVSNYDIYLFSKNIYYIYEDQMIYFVYKNNLDINPDIKHLNIMNINEDNCHLLNDLPINIEYLHISSYENHYDNLNLPINLKKITITLINNDFNNYKIKLPFGCELVTNNIIY